MKPDPALAGETYCYLTTTGRVTGKPHTIEIWFALEQGQLYLMSGGRGRSDWVRNLRRRPQVSVRIGSANFGGQAHIIAGADDDALARRQLLEKYRGRGWGGDLSDWGRTSLPIAIDFESADR